MDRGAVPRCAHSRGANREMAGRARTTDPAHLLWTFEQMYLNLFKKKNFLRAQRESVQHM